MIRSAASKVSVPRRGFIVFLRGLKADRSVCGKKFQSPEGDSLFFYLAEATLKAAIAISFSHPKGIHCFSTFAKTVAKHSSSMSFSPPKGIHCFSTTWHRSRGFTARQ